MAPAVEITTQLPGSGMSDLYPGMDECSPSDATAMEALPALLSWLGPLWATDSKRRADGAAGCCRELEVKGYFAGSLFGQAEAKGQKRRARRQLREWLVSEAARVISDFCEHQLALRIEPTPAEMEALFLACKSWPHAIVSKAFCHQLSWANGDTEWQARMRALCAIEYFSAQDGWGRDVVRSVTSEALEILQYLESDVEQCREKAGRVLAMADVPALPL